MHMTASLSPNLLRITGLAATLLAGGALPASAAAILDPTDDFLSSFIGTKGGDLDVLSAQVFYDGTKFTFTSTENAPIGTTAGTLYVWGVDRGTNNAPFGAFRPGVLFDAVVILRPDGTGIVIDTTGALPAANLPAGSITIAGNTITGTVDKSLLPSLGFSRSNFW